MPGKAGIWILGPCVPLQPSEELYFRKHEIKAIMNVKSASFFMTILSPVYPQIRCVILYEADNTLNSSSLQSWWKKQWGPRFLLVLKF